MCHYRHHSHGDPLSHVGIQDITAHVDFTAVAEAAVDAGLDVLGFTTQANFLLASGLAEILTLQNTGDTAMTKQQLSLNREIQVLTSPAEMGELFKVMALGKGFAESLTGFTIRDMRGRL